MFPSEYRALQSICMLYNCHKQSFTGVRARKSECTVKVLYTRFIIL